MKRQPMQDKPPLIDMHDVTLWRGTTCVFDHFSLRIEQHERVAILGPNGAGKTTLLMAINRELYPVAAGGSHMTILGRERWNVWELRQHIGIVSDDLHLRYPPTACAIDVVLSGFHSSIGIHGSLGKRVTPAQRRAAERVMKDLGIDDLGSKPLGRMSTGQQRRSLLARALVHDPATLILDEPTAGLDLAASFDFLARIRALATRGHSIVLVTHHLNDIPPEVERVVLLAAGRVVADGNKAAVLTDDMLSRVYATPIRVVEIDGHFLACPGKNVT